MWSACARGGRRISQAVIQCVPPTAAASTTASYTNPAVLSMSSGWSSVHNVSLRSLSTTYNPSPLDAFRDSVDRNTRSTQPVGRSWSVQELRRKSYEDLHKLWYVLYKEKNMLLTEQQLSRRRQLIFPQPLRLKKVQKSMQAIKQVLGERKRRKIAEHQASKLEQALQDESEDMDDIEVAEAK